MARRSGDTGEGGDIGTVTVDPSYGYTTDAPRQSANTETSVASTQRAPEVASAPAAAAAPAPAPVATPSRAQPAAAATSAPRAAAAQPAFARPQAAAPAARATAAPASATSAPVTQQAAPPRQVLQSPVRESMGRPGGRLETVAKADAGQAPAAGARRGKVAKVGG